MELREFKKILYQKLIRTGDVEESEEAEKSFLAESAEYDRPMLIFVEIVNEAVERVEDAWAEQEAGEDW
jgi:hypothetical protein